MTILRDIEYNAWFRKKIIIFASILIILVTVVEIWAVNRMATFGSQTAKLEEAKNQLQMENLILEKEIAEKASLLEVQKQAESLGFSKVKDVQYINTQSSIALNR